MGLLLLALSAKIRGPISSKPDTTPLAHNLVQQFGGKRALGFILPDLGALERIGHHYFLIQGACYDLLHKIQDGLLSWLGSACFGFVD